MAIKMILGTLAVLASASLALAQDVNYNYDRSANFGSFKTYRWVDMPGGAKLDEITARQLIAAVEAGLAAKGLTKTDAESADLYIGYEVATTQQTQINAYGMGGGWRWGGGMTTATTSTLTTGSMDLDIYDAAQKLLIWRGTVSKTIDPQSAEARAEHSKGRDKTTQKLPAAGKEVRCAPETMRKEG